MKFFFGFFLVATALCGYFWVTDPAGSGMGIATGIFGGLAVGVGVYNTVKNGGPFNEAKPE